MPDQPDDPLHYEMKIPPEKHTSDKGNDSDQPRPEVPPDSMSKEDDAGSHGEPQTKHP
jgi:hypothetical protein